jgi:hypothetical protein
MSWELALTVVIAMTRHERYRVLCADDWPDHEAYRALMVRMANGEDAPSNQSTSDLDRAIRLIAENPPESMLGNPCGGCPDQASDFAGNAGEQVGNAVAEKGDGANANQHNQG